MVEMSLRLPMASMVADVSDDVRLTTACSQVVRVPGGSATTSAPDRSRSASIWGGCVSLSHAGAGRLSFWRVRPRAGALLAMPPYHNLHRTVNQIFTAVCYCASHDVLVSGSGVVARRSSVVDAREDERHE